MTTYCRLLVLVLVSCLSAAGAVARAQAPAAGPTKIYTKQTGFRLPLQIDDKERAELQEVKLFVKMGPADTWTCKDTVPPTQTNFTYHVSQEGEYWFTVVTVDKTGKSTPADLNREPPGLIVVVDTTLPEVEVHPLTLPSGERFLECKVRDANPDYNQVKLEYRTDRGWQALEAYPDEKGLFLAPEAALKGMVRATATDKAGNTTTREFDLSATRLTEGPSGVATDTETRVQKPATPSLTPARSTGSPTLQLINSRHASLDYQIDSVGASGIGKVEVWLTKDEGQSWQLLCEDPDKKSPVEIDLPGEGLFGLSLVVTNGSGIGNAPPSKGDVPDWWVEVDTTKPTAQLLPVRPSAGEDGNAFLLAWTASDKNLKAEPIDLYYATDRQGTWFPIARGLKNTGSYRWPVPRGQGPDFYFRLDVSDRAGNVTKCETTEPLVLDMTPPKSHVLGVASATRVDTSKLTPLDGH